jgi:hypothetical protein
MFTKRLLSVGAALPPKAVKTAEAQKLKWTQTDLYLKKQSL